MAELLECLICGYKTVRCGMTNHLKAKHPDKHPQTGSFSIEDFTKSLGNVKNWSQNRHQVPKTKKV